MKTKKLLIVTGDVNDGDFITKEHWDIDDNTISRLQELLVRLRSTKKVNGIEKVLSLGVLANTRIKKIIHIHYIKIFSKQKK